MFSNIVFFLPSLIYLVPIIFLAWFLVKFLRIQQEKNSILKTISDKLDKLNN